MVRHRKGRSPMWAHFEICDIHNKTAICNYCKRVMSYKSTTSNLRAHLNKRHTNEAGEIIAAENRLPDNPDEDNEDLRLTSQIWGYYETESGGRVRCVVCRATCINSVSSLREHLEEKHPKLLAEIVENAGSETDDDNADTTYTEIVYLEDESKPEPPKKRERKINQMETIAPLYKRNEKRKASFSSDEQPIKNKKLSQNSEDEELDSFITYITCLLKQVPKHVFSKVQMDIVNIVMNAKMQAQNNIIIEHLPNEETMQVIVNLDNTGDARDVKELCNENTITNAVATSTPSLNDCKVSNSTDN